MVAAKVVVHFRSTSYIARRKTMDALWKSTVLSLIEVNGACLVRGNARFLETWADPDTAKSWVDLLEFADASAPMDWLGSAE